MNRQEIVTRISRVVHQQNPTAEVILYGSEARGDARPDSDIDILVIVDQEKITFSDKTGITYPLYDIEFETGVSISPIVTTKKEWYNRPFKTPFYVNVMNEGRRI